MFVFELQQKKWLKYWVDGGNTEEENMKLKIKTTNNKNYIFPDFNLCVLRI